MKHSIRTLFFLFLFILSVVLPAFAQVHVRGYHRSNGTYVQPHQRTSPNSTITDNYSYPGNYNPNTGRVTGGNTPTYTHSSSPSTSRAISTYESPSGSAAPTNTYRSPSASRQPLNYFGTYSGTYRYRTVFDSPIIIPPLRSSPNPNSSEIYACPLNAYVYVIESVPGSVYYKASVNGRVGYISKSLLSSQSSYLNSSVTNAAFSNAPSVPTTFKFKTTFDDPGINPPLRDGPSPLAAELYSCPQDAAVYVLEKAPGNSYWKVSVNGHIGYISKALIR